MLVYVLFHETNSGHSEESDGYVEAIYATEEAAEAAKLAAIRRLVAEGEDVYWNPDAPEGEQEGPSDWTDDFKVVPFEVRAEAPKPDAYEYTCPKCHALPGASCIRSADRRSTSPHPARVRRAVETEAPKAVRS
jgi:hypothetical protein